MFIELDSFCYVFFFIGNFQTLSVTKCCNWAIYIEFGMSQSKLHCTKASISYKFKMAALMIELWKVGNPDDWTLDCCKLWTVGPFDYYNVKYQMDD